MSQLAHDDLFDDLVKFIREVQNHIESYHIKNEIDCDVTGELYRKSITLLKKVDK